MRDLSFVATQGAYHVLDSRHYPTVKIKVNGQEYVADLATFLRLVEVLKEIGYKSSHQKLYLDEKKFGHRRLYRETYYYNQHRCRRVYSHHNIHRLSGTVDSNGISLRSMRWILQSSKSLRLPLKFKKKPPHPYIKLLPKNNKHKAELNLSLLDLLVDSAADIRHILKSWHEFKIPFDEITSIWQKLQIPFSDVIGATFSDKKIIRGILKQTEVLPALIQSPKDLSTYLVHAGELNLKIPKNITQVWLDNKWSLPTVLPSKYLYDIKPQNLPFNKAEFCEAVITNAKDLRTAMIIAGHQEFIFPKRFFKHCKHLNIPLTDLLTDGKFSWNKQNILKGILLGYDNAQIHGLIDLSVLSEKINLWLEGIIDAYHQKLWRITIFEQLTQLRIFDSEYNLYVLLKKSFNHPSKPIENIVFNHRESVQNILSHMLCGIAPFQYDSLVISGYKALFNLHEQTNTDTLLPYEISHFITYLKENMTSKSRYQHLLQHIDEFCQLLGIKDRVKKEFIAELKVYRPNLLGIGDCVSGSIIDMGLFSSSSDTEIDGDTYLELNAFEC